MKLYISHKTTEEEGLRYEYNLREQICERRK